MSKNQTRLLPAVFVWRDVDVVDQETGEVERVKAMVPLRRYKHLAERQFHDMEDYPLAVLEARDRNSHNHYFAAVHEGWQNLPEDIAARFPSAEHLRKWCLIEAGLCDEEEFEFETITNAQRFARFYRKESDYARISVHGSKVIIRHAKSQSAKAMAKGPFEESKKAVLDIIAGMIGVRRSELNRAAGRAA